MLNQPIKNSYTKISKMIAVLNWGETRLRQLYGKKIIVKKLPNDGDWEFVTIKDEKGYHSAVF